MPATALSVLHGHIQTIFCLGMDSALLHVLQSHTQIHNQVVWQQENETCLPETLQRRRARLRRKGSVLSRCQPASLRGELSGMEVPLHSGSRRPGVGEGLAGRIGLQSGQLVRAEPLLTEPHITARSSSGPTWCLQKP